MICDIVEQGEPALPVLQIETGGSDERKVVLRRPWAWALCLVGVASAPLAETEFSATAEAGYRVDELTWSIAGWNTGPGRSGQYVNVLSELSWRDVQIREWVLGLEARHERVYFTGRVAVGDINDGDNQDSDYDFDDRQGEWSRSNNGVFGDTLDASMSLGYRFDLHRGDGAVMHLMPVVGAALHQQNFGMNDGFQTIYTPDPSLVGSGVLDGLNSTYDAEWETAWLGLSLWQSLTAQLTLRLDLEFHRGDYSAVANWNLRQDLAHPVSFAHWADGQGMVVGVNGRYTLSEQLFFMFGLSYGDWDTDPGVDRVFLSNGSILETPLNKAAWQSLGLNLGVGLRF
mgnify:CR=1 FL=1